MNRCDRWSSLYWLAISVFVCIESIKMGTGSFQSPGPGFLPFCSGVFVAALSILLFVISTLKKSDQPKLWNPWNEKQWRKVILVAVSLFVYSIILPRLGFLITTFGLMTLLFSIVERSRPWIQAVTALITVLVTYFAFYHWLGVQLPKGLVGF
jgi:putative tricarboxylic transport membrane protein